VCFWRESNRNHIVTPLPTLSDIPDPKVDPLNVINSLLAVLHEMGPWCTQRAAQHFYHCNEGCSFRLKCLQGIEGYYQFPPK